MLMLILMLMLMWRLVLAILM